MVSCKTAGEAIKNVQLMCSFDNCLKNVISVLLRCALMQNYKLSILLKLTDTRNSNHPYENSISVTSEIDFLILIF